MTINECDWNADSLAILGIQIGTVIIADLEYRANLERRADFALFIFQVGPTPDFWYFLQMTLNECGWNTDSLGTLGIKN